MKVCDCGCMEPGKDAKAEQTPETPESRGALKPQDEEQGQTSTNTGER